MYIYFNFPNFLPFLLLVAHLRQILVLEKETLLFHLFVSRLVKFVVQHFLLR